MSQLAGYIRVDPQTWENIQAQGKTQFGKLKPVGEFFDRTRFSPPKDVNQFTGRLQVNLKYYQANYILFGLICILYSLISNLWLLFDVAFVLGGVYYISALPEHEPVSFLNGKVAITKSQAWVALSCTAVLLLWFTSAGSTIFWIASFVLICICIHAGFMERPIENDFEETV